MNWEATVNEDKLAPMLRAGIPFLADLLRVLVLLAFYLVLRVLFIDNYSEVRPEGFASLLSGGFRFDLWAILWLSLPYFLIRLFHQKEQGMLAKISKWIFIIPNVFGILLGCLDLEYFAFSKRRTTADYLDIASGGGDFWNVVGSLFPDFMLAIVVFVIMSILLVSAHRKIGLILYPAQGQTLGRLFWSACWLALLAIGLRGGIQHKPITTLSAGQYASVEQYAMVLNTPFVFLKSLEEKELKAVEYMPPAQAEQLWPTKHALIKDPGDLTGYNVVLIIMESFSASMSSTLSPSKSSMPFLDSLMRTNIHFTRAYANGTRSVDALPALTAGIPYLMDHAFVYSKYAGSQISSLPALLSEEGYTSAFFHGGRNGTMGFDDYCKAAGFAAYFGENEYTGHESDKGDWGVHDGPFLNWTAQEINDMDQPFFATIFTLSSHHPYDIPETFEAAQGETPLQTSVRYADASLRHFFNGLSKELKEKTMFIITADHTSEDQALSKLVHERYQVPLLVHLPGREVAFASDKVVQHIDVVPMTLDFLGYEKEFFSFGQDLRGQKEGAALMREGGLYHYIGHQGTIVLDGDSLLSSKAINGEPLPKKAQQRYFSRAQAGIQQFNNHLRERRLVSDGP